MDIKAMIKLFGPIVLFSIILPFVDILTDLRLISRLYFGNGTYRCLSNSDRVMRDERECLESDDRPTYCRLNPTVCEFTTPIVFATMLIGDIR